MATDVDFFGNITNLTDLNISSLASYINARGYTPTWAGILPCEPASDLLPIGNLSELQIVAPNPKIRDGTVRVTMDPSDLNIGFLQLHDFSQQVFPSPLNESEVGEVVLWWRNSTKNDKKATADFLSEVVNTCSKTFCRHRSIQIGNPDIIGIGMIVATSMLLILVACFSTMSLGPLTEMVARPLRKKHVSFRQAAIGTVDELFSAVYVFAISVMVSTFAYRYRTDSRFDVLMADGLSLVCSTTVVMLAATYWAHNRERPHATGSVIATVFITIALFATHFNVASKRASPVELACGTGKGGVSVRKGDPFDIKVIKFIPLGFASWCLALVGAVFHHPILHARKPAEGRKVALFFWRVAESLPCVFGIIGLGLYAGYFFNTWRMMKSTYGKAFTSAEKDWGFGQYLAVFTWLPPIMSFIHLYFAGLKGMLEARLPKGWKVYHEDHPPPPPDVFGESSCSQFDFKGVGSNHSKSGFAGCVVGVDERTRQRPQDPNNDNTDSDDSPGPNRGQSRTAQVDPEAQGSSRHQGAKEQGVRYGQREQADDTVWPLNGASSEEGRRDDVYEMDAMGEAREKGPQRNTAAR